MSIDIGIIQFPGSNTERETIMACQRAKMNPIEFLWNEPAKKLNEFHGYIIIGGFSYEDRSRAGVIASLDPIIKQIKIEAKKGKPVLGICNGAQILVESGMIPGLKDNRLGIALTDNKRIKDGYILGVGYYNAWTKLKLSITPDRCAFTRHMDKNDQINIPLAHGEGRFILPDNLLEKMIKNEQAAFLYCDKNGKTINEFPINPNGSMHNIAAVCNPAGNIMAIMPHPERTKNGDAIFSSMKDFIEQGNPVTNHTLEFESHHYDIIPFRLNKNSTEWIINMIITDNEEKSVQSAIRNLGYDVSIKRQTHWEISTNSTMNNIIEQIDATGELYNSNKEYINHAAIHKNTASFLIRQKEDIKGRAKLESLTERFGISGITDLKHGVLWNVIVNSGSFELVLNHILETHILFNPLSHECYRIN
tara:strand:+ start:797 stop:2056 length:1260 start_codon:yes stop_codon:yes gene_type:complete